MNTAERNLKLLLRVVGITSLPAIVAVFMPYSWLVRSVELAEPGTPVLVLVSYLARLLSAFYVLLGGMMVVFSTDVRRYAGAIRLVALWSLMAVVGFLIYGAPALVKGGFGWFIWFVAGDVVFGFALAVAILLLQWRIAKQDKRQAPDEN
ncbi:MAG TPA: hypothetical protein HPP66_05945 [Planctomycetes bacterium]|nr:hypothetical protein [Planctomycetota bacterium]